MTVGFCGYVTLEEAAIDGVTREQWQEKATAFVTDLERQIIQAKAKIAELQMMLRVAERSRQAAFYLGEPENRHAADNEKP